MFINVKNPNVCYLENFQGNFKGKHSFSQEVFIFLEIS